MEKVSIIVPVYNVEKYIERCLNSLINQTYKNIEIIIVNDGSKDKSLEICEKYQEEDKRIKLISKNNEGLGLARNTGLEYVTGKYILFVDSDDYVELNLVETTYKLAEKYNCDLVRFHNYRENLSNGEKTVKKTPLIEGLYVKEQVTEKLVLPMIGLMPEQTGNHFVGMSVWRNLYKTDIIKKNNLIFDSERVFIAEDILFNMKYLQLVDKAYVINQPLYHYIVNDKSLTGKYNPDRFTKCIELYKEMNKRLKQSDIKGKYELRLQRKVLDGTRMCINIELNRKEVSWSVKKRAIINICNDEYLRDILEVYPIKKMQLPYRISWFMIKNKLVLGLYIIYKVFKKV